MILACQITRPVPLITTGLDLGRFCINFVLRFEPTGCGLNETRKGTQSHTADDAVKLGGGRKETRWQTRRS